MKALGAVQTTSASSSSTGSNFLLQRKCACGGPAGLSGTCEDCADKQLLGMPLQAKLVVGSPDDPLEREADRVADQVMRMPEPEQSQSSSNTNDGPSPLHTTLIQRRHSGSFGSQQEAPNVVHDVLHSSGQPLGADERKFFERRFGHDFSNVRVHKGAMAGASASAIQARAYTIGHHIAFAEGQYSPSTADGKLLLAHELAHVMQQHGENPIRSEAQVANQTQSEHGAKIDAGSLTTKNSREVDPVIRRACGSTEIGTIASCTARGGDIADFGESSESVYLFSRDCDEFSPGEQTRLETYANTIDPSLQIDVDGFASEEGDTGYNGSLSCARAQKVQEIVSRVAGVNVHAYSHGATPGDRPSHRSAVISARAHPTESVPEADEGTHSDPAVVAEADPYFDPVAGENVCDDSSYCTPYATSAEASSARSYLLSYFIPLLEGYFGADVGGLWRSYLSRRPGDSLAPRVFDTSGNSIYEAFSTNNFIHDEVDAVLDLIANRLSRGYGNVTQPLDNFLSASEKNLSTNFANPLTIPGNIAGGIGSSDAGHDRRRITWGTVSFDITELPFGNRMVEIEAFVNFEVKDAIDFCPGQCGAILEQSLATIRMSRLEASGEAYDVPFIVRFPGPRKTKTVFV